MSNSNDADIIKRLAEIERDLLEVAASPVYKTLLASKKYNPDVSLGDAIQAVSSLNYALNSQPAIDLSDVLHPAVAEVRGCNNFAQVYGDRWLDDAGDEIY